MMMHGFTNPKRKMYLTGSYFCSSNYNRLVAASYESLSFGKSFKTPFAVTLVCTYTIYHFAGAVVQPPDRVTRN